MTDVVGKATLQATADVSQLKAGLKEGAKAFTGLEQAAKTAGRNASTSVDGVGKAAQAAAKRAEASNARWMKGLETLSATYGKPKSALLEFQAAQRGMTEQAAPYIAKLKALEAANVGLGMSAKATANAMRMVPAQMTDIVTQLAGGQNPLLILTQQGGQLKDMFGGIGPALRGLGSYVASLVNPFTVAGAAMATLGLAYEMGSRESLRFNESLVLTGNFVGRTSDQIGAMAASIGQTVGTTGKAADALNKIAATGKIAGDSIEDIASAAVSMSEATGRAVDDTIAEFVKLGEAPVDTILKLNDAQHFLTAAVYEQISALEEAGRKDEAAALAQQTYAHAVQDRANEVIRSAGLLERAWNGIAAAAKGAWDAMLNIGRPTPVAELRRQAEAIQEQINQINFGAGAFADTAGGAATGGGDRARRRALANLTRQLADINAAIAQANGDEFSAQARAADQQLQQQRIAAKRRLDEQAKATRSRQKQREDEIAQLKRDAAIVGLAEDELAKRIAAINEKYKDPKGAVVRDDAAARMLMQLKEQEAALNAQLETVGKIGQKQSELAKFEQQIADLKTKSVLTADQKSLLANENALRAQLQKNAAIEHEVRLKQEAAKVDALRQALDMQLANDQRQYAESLDAQGQGRRAQEELRAQQRIMRDYQRQLQQAGRDRLTGAITDETYQDQLSLLQSSLDQRLEAQRRYYDDLRAVEADWRVGASAALADYADVAANVAQSAAGAFSNAFKGMEDALANFVMTGKLSFSDLANSIIKDMVRIAVQQSITGPLAGALGSFFTPSAPAGVTPGVDWTFASGGFTGPGGKYEPAGIVHRGEYVLNQDATRRIGVGVLDRLNKGYANGGLVGGGQIPSANNGVVLNITNQGQPVTASQPKVSMDSVGRLVIDVMLQDAQRNGPYIRQLRGAM